jgi:hypothetical protein
MTKTKQWGDFFPTKSEHPAKLIHSREYLSEHLNEAIAALSVGNQTTSIGIAQDEVTGELIYVVTCLAKEDPEAIAASLPKHVANVPVRVKATTDSPISAGKRRIEAPIAFSRSLLCGMSIVNDRLYRRPEDIERIGSVGCFVRLNDGGVAALTTRHTLVGDGDGGKAGDPVSSPEYSEEFYVGEVHSYTEIGTDHPAILGPSLTYCKADAALAKLDKGVPYSPDFEPRCKRLLPPSLRISGTGEPALKQDVFKVGQTTGITFGRISAVDVSIVIQYPWGNVAFKGAFQVVSREPRGFSEPGDSGAAIVGLDGLVIGLLIANQKGVAIGLPIAPALDELSCQLIRYQDLPQAGATMHGDALPCPSPVRSTSRS